MPVAYQRADVRKTHVTLGRRGTPSERFQVKIRIARNGCWIWIGSLNRGLVGYPQFWDGQRLVRAHRWSYERAYRRSIPAGITLDHACGDTRCVNPSHLQLMTRRENSRRGRELQVTGKH